MKTAPHVVIAGGGFAGFACAKALAEGGVRATVLERKKAAGVGMHTTGIIVKECADEFHVPDDIVRRVTDVRLFAPNLKSTSLKSRDYFFLTTDTPRLMQYLASEAQKAGASIIYDTAYEGSRIEGDKVIVNPLPNRGRVGVGASTAGQSAIEQACPPPAPPLQGEEYVADFLIGADGPRSKVSADYALGKNTEFLLGAEAEYTGLPLFDDNAFYCFLDQNLAHGYLGWVIPGVGVAQVGIAQRMPRKPDIDAFVARMKSVFDFSNAQVVARRGGLIPCGGLVRPFANERVVLLGDAAGIVSPLTAGGIHTALRYGRMTGELLARHLMQGGPHPAEALEKVYPRFTAKLALRKIFEHTPNSLLNLAIGNPLFSFAAGEVFYRKKRLK